MQSSLPPYALAVLAATAADEADARSLSRDLNLPLLPTAQDPEGCEHAGVVLLVSGARRCLQITGRGAPGPVAADFSASVLRRRRTSGAPELLGRAVGQGRKARLRVVDATAGLGGDAFVLAGLGCEVLMCEREPVVAELLRSALELAARSAEPALDAVVERLHLWRGDARRLEPQRLAGVDVICLDPMFPVRSKSAAVKKEMALFQALLSHADGSQGASGLLHWALSQDVARVVVKRPAKAPPLSSQPPSHSVRGKAVRYDVYVRRRIT